MPGRIAGRTVIVATSRPFGPVAVYRKNLAPLEIGAVTIPWSSGPVMGLRPLGPAVLLFGPGIALFLVH